MNSVCLPRPKTWGDSWHSKTGRVAPTATGLQFVVSAEMRAADQRLWAGLAIWAALVFRIETVPTDHLGWSALVLVSQDQTFWIQGLLFEASQVHLTRLLVRFILSWTAKCHVFVVLLAKVP